MAYTFLDAAVTTQVLADGPCVLDRVIVGKGTAAAVTIYNSATSVGIATSDIFALLTIEEDQGIGVYECKTVLDKGLTVTLAGDSDVTFVYYTRDIDGGVPHL